MQSTITTAYSVTQSSGSTSSVQFDPHKDKDNSYKYDATFMEDSSQSGSPRSESSSGTPDSSDDDTVMSDGTEDPRTLLEEQGIRLDENNSQGVHVLMQAAWDGDRKLVEALLLAGVPVNGCNQVTGDNALILAASCGRSNVVSALLAVENINLNVANRNGDTALMLASGNNFVPIVEQLLEKRADANIVNAKRSYTALTLAADYGFDDIASLLIAHFKKSGSTGLNAVNSGGDTALILASAAKHAKIVKLLLDADAATNISDNQGYTALTAAIAAEDAAIVEMLLEKGAELENFDSFSGSLNTVRVTVSDLAKSKGGTSSGFKEPDDPLQFFKELAQLVPCNGDNLPLLRWLHGKGLALAWAQELASLLAPAHAWALNAAKRNSANVINQQRLIYCLGALGQLAAGSSADNVQTMYRESGISVDGQKRLCIIAREQLTALVKVAEDAAAQLGSELMNTLIARCLAQTSSKYEIRQDKLRNHLVQDGFIEPLAQVIASSWQATVAEILREPNAIPPNITFADNIEHIHAFVVMRAERSLANAVKQDIRPQKFIHAFNSILPSKSEGAISDLYQIQHSWLSQFYEQSPQIKANT